MNDMSAPKRAVQRKKLDEPTYNTIVARTAKVFDPSERILADIAELAPTIAAHAAEIEAERGIPPNLIAALRSIGVFRMFAPRSHGGLELDLRGGLAVITALAKIEGSLGWTALIASIGALIPPLLPRATYDRIYRDGPDVIFAGSIQPPGTAERTAGGWRGDGRWPTARGSRHR